ncbi:MAG: hypothetical protein MI806_00295, partial [Minwuiales bacterium]|nr:hypothetical protein [Minwuiales bacterium]
MANEAPDGPCGNLGKRRINHNFARHGAALTKHLNGVLAGIWPNDLSPERLGLTASQLRISAVLIGFGNTPPPQFEPLKLDTNLLLASFNNRINKQLAASASVNALNTSSNNGPNADIVPIWEPEFGGDVEQDVKERLLAKGPLIDLDDPDLNREGIDEDTKQLFAAYKALRRIQELARFAANDPAGRAMSTILQAQFDRYEKEFVAFVDGLNIDGLNIISGKKEESIKAEAISPKTRATFTGDAKFGSGDEVIADIDPNA